MYDLLKGWLDEAGRWPGSMPGWIAENPVVLIGVVAVILAMAGRHRRTLFETLLLSALALVALRFAELPANLLAVGALLHATHGSSRRKADRQFNAVDRRVDAIQASLDGFLRALDRRSREVDGWGAGRELAPGKIIGPEATAAASRSSMNGAEPDAQTRDS